MPTRVGEELPEVVRALLAQWLHVHDVPMSVAEYVSAGRRGELDPELEAPFQALFA